ncbi:hypothetical protein [Enterobacter sp. NIC22-4]|uniref:hypothetical protein n=1 Tax=Enterobacter sp. NIC22-4 TaxID=2870772 RepID=UPI0021AE83BB|nr:hypothetical protein [Enterobacter sp. NIC22-4]
MSNIDKHAVQAVADLKAGYTLGHADVAILKELARIALASLEAEPYGYVHKAAYEQAGSCGLSGDHEAYRDSSTHIAVYTTPPAPVSVPDAYVRDERGRMMLNGRQEPRIGYGAGWNGYRAAMFRGADGNTQVIPDCTCRTCRPVTFSDSRFVVCPDCGNKRCPHANDHRHACTGSNESGQEGSAYPAAGGEVTNKMTRVTIDINQGP